MNDKSDFVERYKKCVNCMSSVTLKELPISCCLKIKHLAVFVLVVSTVFLSACATTDSQNVPEPELQVSSDNADKPNSDKAAVKQPAQSKETKESVAKSAESKKKTQKKAEEDDYNRPEGFVGGIMSMWQGVKDFHDWLKGKAPWWYNSDYRE